MLRGKTEKNLQEINRKEFARDKRESDEHCDMKIENVLGNREADLQSISCNNVVEQDSTVTKEYN